MKGSDGIGTRNVWKQWLLPVLLALPGILAVLYYILGPAKGYFTSDCADSLLWAKETLESGKTVSDSFYYAAVLPFGGNLILAPFVWLFGYSFTAQAWGMATFAVLLALAMYFMARGIGLSRAASAGFISVVFLILSSGAKLREILWEHIFYYNLGILFFCFGFGLVLRILKQDGDVLAQKKKGDLTFSVFLIVTAVCAAVTILCAHSYVLLSVCFGILTVAAIVLLTVFSVRGRRGYKTPREWVYLAVLCLFTVMASWNGLLSLVCFVLPVAAGLGMECIASGEPLLGRTSRKTIAVTAGFLLSALVGLASVARVTGGVTAAYAEAYSEYSVMSQWLNNFLGFFNHWFSLSGVSVTEEIPLASLDGILTMIRIFTALLLLVYPLVLLCRFSTLRHRGTRMVLVGHAAVLAFILFAVTFGRLGNAEWRLTPALGTAVIATFIGAWDRLSSCKISLSRARIGALICAVLVLSSAITFNDIRKMPADYGRGDCWDTAAEALRERGLENGYATFWFAHPLNVASGGELCVRAVAENKAPPVRYRYQTEAVPDHAAGKHFLLLCQTEIDRGSFDLFLTESRENGSIIEEFTVQTGHYAVRGYEGDVMYVFVFASDFVS